MLLQCQEGKVSDLQRLCVHVCVYDKFMQRAERPKIQFDIFSSPFLLRFALSSFKMTVLKPDVSTPKHW